MTEKRVLTRILTVAALSAALAWPPAAEANARLGRLLSERFARYALIETAEGKSFAREVLGRQARTTADLDELLVHLRRRDLRPLGNELVRRLERIRAGVEGAEGARALSEAQKLAIEAGASNELSIALSGAGRIRFTARTASPNSLGSVRSRFVGSRARSEFTGPEASRLVRRYRSPLSGAFPRGFSTADLDSRISGFVSRYPDRIRVVEDVRFDLPGGHGVRDSRRVVIVSIRDLSERKSRQLTADYLNAVGRGTVSFPLPERAGHLYTRAGNQVVNFLNGVEKEAYRLPRVYEWSEGTRRLEPVVALRLEEELRLRRYIQNAIERPDSVLGDFGYNGPRDGATRGQLGNNQPTGSADHNCTSWMATAPIGVDGGSLKSLVGARPGWEIHTNPGWWQGFLVSSPAARERVPYVIYWTDETLAQAQRTVRSGRKLNWDFDVH